MNKSDHPLYNTWLLMHERCENPYSRKYKDYGRRGIKVCERWKDFHKFVDDMGDKPDGHTLNRKDNSRGYSPENCNWETHDRQRLNQRLRRDNTSGYIGVSSDPYNREPKRYKVALSISGTYINFGWYEDAIHAAYIADQLKLALRGDDVPMNFLGSKPYHPSFVDT